MSNRLVGCLFHEIRYPLKVKRLFLYMAEKANHQWLRFIDISDIDLGSGNRRITRNGQYHGKYQLTLPKELINLE